MAQSTELTEFYQYYKQWVDGNTDIPFQATTGLRGNLWIACGSDNKQFEKLLDEMQLSFLKSNLNVLFPFNESQENRIEEFKSGKAQLNKARIKWVSDHAGN